MSDLQRSEPSQPSRRQWLVQASTLLAVAIVPKPLHAAPTELEELMQQHYGVTEITEGRVTLTLPALAENGNSVPLTVAVDSPMTPTNYVAAIDIFAPQNPLANVVNFELGAINGRALVSTRIRLSDSQPVVAIARMNDGSLWSGSAEIVVTIAACLDFLI